MLFHRIRTKDDLVLLTNTLRLPNLIICNNGLKVVLLEAICIVLRRLAYPARLDDLARQFGRTKDELSRIFNTTVKLLYERYGHLLQWDKDRLTPRKLKEYADAISNKGSPLKRCVGFVDGTVRQICRPKKHQKEVYNGHRRVHYIKFQSVMAPDGVIIHLAGPFEGIRHDARMLVESDLLEYLQKFCHEDDIEKTPYYIYGDLAYPLSQ
jgi:AraC-like DNA-binding protein